MPLPDAKPSTRIYELLKNTDLENITFSQFQGVAKTIFAEQGAEDELRRIVLLNLARLSVAGEWTGLTTAGGGGGGAYAVLFDGDITFSISATTSYQPLFGINSGYGNTTMNSSEFRSFFFYRPFYAWKTAQLTNVHYRVQTAQPGATMDLAIYESDDDGRPSNKIGSVSGATLASTGGQSASVTEESTGSMSLTKGNLYWIGIKDNSSGSSPQLRGTINSDVQPLGLSNLGSGTTLVAYTTLLGTSSAGSTFSFFGVSQNNAPMLGGEYA
jgi:hypothetical protein